MKSVFLGIFLILCTATVACAVQLVFHIPSSATTENSRLYMNLLGQFEQENPGVQVTFSPRANYNEVLNELLSLSEQEKGGWVAVVEVSELQTLKDNGAIRPLEKMMESEPDGKSVFLEQFLPSFLGNS